MITRTIILSCFILATNVAQSQPLCDFQGKDSLVAKIRGDSLEFWDFGACAYCSSKFAISVNATTDSITLVETDTASELATCECIYDLGTLILGLSGGTYTIVVYRDFPSLHYHGFVGSLQVNYQPAKSGVLAWFPYQLGCLSNDVPKADHQLPANFALFPNYPNPFNPSTTIRFSVPYEENVVIRVYDVLGREVTTLLSTYMPPGTYSVRLDLGSEHSSGVYFCRMRAGSFTQTITMTFQK